MDIKNNGEVLQDFLLVNSLLSFDHLYRLQCLVPSACQTLCCTSRAFFPTNSRHFVVVTNVLLMESIALFAFVCLDFSTAALKNSPECVIATQEDKDACNTMIFMSLCLLFITFWTGKLRNLN